MSQGDKGQVGSDAHKVICRTRPSQYVNVGAYVSYVAMLIIIVSLPYTIPVSDALKPYLVLVAKILFFLPFVLAFWSWLKIRCHSYEVTPERLIERYGILNRVSEELELFRVKDISYVQPLLLRLFGLGNVVLDTSDKSTPIVVVYGIKNGSTLVNTLRHHVDIMRVRKGVREID